MAVVWEGHRPQTSVSTGGITWNNPGNAYDVSSAIPDTTSPATGTWPQATQDGFLRFYNFSNNNTGVDSYYQAGIRMWVGSLAGTNPDYWGLQYSVDSGANWNSWVASAGRFSAASTWQIASLAWNIDLAQFQIKVDATRVGGADSAGRVSIWDVYLVGTATNGGHPPDTVAYSATAQENLGMTDVVNRSMEYGRNIADGLGVTDAVNRSMTFVRRPGG